MAEITASNSKKRNRLFSNFHNRRSTKVDLTPMVDLGFLLITFFVFTTSMTEPKAMNILETHDGNPKPVKDSYAMTIILSKNHDIYYYYGKFDPENPIFNIQKSNFASIRSKIVDKKRISKPEYLMYLIKADKMSTFGDNINLLDEMSICDIPSGHYAEVNLTQEEEIAIMSKSKYNK